MAVDVDQGLDDFGVSRGCYDVPEGGGASEQIPKGEEVIVVRFGRRPARLGILPRPVRGNDEHAVEGAVQELEIRNACRARGCDFGQDLLVPCCF